MTQHVHRRAVWGRLVAFLLAVLVLGTGLMACSDSEETSTGNFVVIEMDEDLGTIVIELAPEDAPITVEHFRKLVHDGFYDGLTFHRIIAGFMIQGGDPDGNGTGGSGENIKGEFTANGVENTLKHVRGTVSMARGNAFDSASSQFFICVNDDGVQHLDGQYAAFGTVISGIEVADQVVENALVTPGYRPKMKSVTLSETDPTA